LLAASKSNRETIEELFWAALTRPPSESELKDLLNDVEAAEDRRVELEDIIWGLLNSKDFMFRK
jgi:Tfp pilus assembly protein PilO